MSNSALVQSILAGNRVINREEKLGHTVDAMQKNIVRQAESRAKFNASKENGNYNDSDRGYGRGKRMGD